jgi:chaperonin GroES
VAYRLQPLGDRVVVKPIEKEVQTKSGIVLPDTAKERPQEGEILAVGPGEIGDDGKRKPMDVTAGDRVVYSKFSGTEFKGEEDEELLIMRQADILAKVS